MERTAAHRRAHALLTLLACGSVAACSGEDFDLVPSGPAVSFSSGSASMAEGGSAIALTVTLSSPGGPLEEDVTVDVVDTEAGTASAGTDYSAVGRRTVTFPAGSDTGATEVVAVQPVADSVAEGADETITLRLENASGASAFGITSAVVTIEEDDFASVSFTAPSTVTGDESATSYTLDVTLDLGPGSTLGFDIDLVAGDDGTGTASSGADYVAIQTASVSFPSGSLDGDMRQLTVQVLDDSDVEGTEFFAVAISGDSLGQLDATGGPLRHIVSITDDESPAGPAFAASSGITGTETQHASGDTIDLGTSLVGGLGGETLLTIANQGGGAMDLGQPLLEGTDRFDFDIEIESSSTASLGAMARPAGVELDLASPFRARAQSAADGASAAKPGLAADFDVAELVDLDVASTIRLHGVPLPNIGQVTVRLDRVELPIAADAVLAVNGQPVTGGPRALLGDISTWSGEAVEIPGSQVFLMIGPDGPEGYVQLPFGEGQTVHITTETRASGASPAACRFIHEADIARLGGERPTMCSGVAAVPGAPQGVDLGPGTAAMNGPGTSQLVTTPNVRLAIETDHQFYQRFNDETALTNYVTGMIAAISDRFRADVQTTLSIAYLGIHTTSADPWSSQDSGGDAEDVLLEFRAAWNGSGWPAQADLAHFLSGANLGGGIAYLNVLCNQSFGYGVSGNLNGNINWGAWTGTPGSFTWDFVVVAHELGHNFGANHTHEYCPPIDVCATNCDGSTQCSQGTIMSYCHACGGMDNIDLHFHQQIATRMRSRVEASCLGDADVPAGDFVRYRLRFAPESAAGPKSATLRFDHSAANAPSPFVLNLTGTAN